MDDKGKWEVMRGTDFDDPNPQYNITSDGTDGFISTALWPEQAQKLAQAHNADLAAKDEEIARLRGIVENVNEYAALELDAAEAMDALSPRWVSEVLNLTNKEADGPLSVRINELEGLLGHVGVYLDKLGVEYEMSELQDFVASQVINHDRAADGQTRAALSGKADNE